MQTYLKQQWAGMMYRFLTTESESRRVSDLFTSISNATSKIEFLTRQVVNAVGDPITKLNVEFYDYLLSQGVAHDLTFWGLKPSPKEILKHETIDNFCNNKIEIEEEADGDDFGYSIRGGGPPYQISRSRYDSDEARYTKTRNHFIKRLTDANLTIDDFTQKNETEPASSEANLT